MKRLILACFVAISSAFAAGESTVPSKPGSERPSSEAAGGPQITFDETRHDFGTVEPQELKHSFKVKNTGTSMLEIKNVQAKCGCTVVPDWQKKIEAGKESIIEAKLNLANMKGHVEKGITVTSNDPKSPSIELTLAADIKVDLMLMPSQNIWFGKLTPDSQTNQVLEIRSNLAQPLEIKNVDSPSTWITAKIVSSGTNYAKLEVATKPPLPYGQNRGQITLETGYEKEQNKKLTINVTATVPAAISATPFNLIFPANQAKAIGVNVLRNDGKDFHIKEIKSPTPTIMPTITTNVDGRSYRVSFNYTPENGKTLAGGKIEIVTDEPSWPKVEISYGFR